MKFYRLNDYMLVFSYLKQTVTAKQIIKKFCIKYIRHLLEDIPLK